MTLKAILEGPPVFLKRLAGFCIRKLQGLSVYRRIAGMLRCGIVIEEANDQSLEKFHDLFNPIGIEGRFSLNPNTTNFIAKKGVKLIGFVQLARRLKRDNGYAEYWLYSLNIKTLYRGMGIGEVLTRQVMQKAEEEKAKELSLLVSESNFTAIRLYRKLGFEMRVIPNLEAQLEKESHTLGYRRVVMSRSLID